MIQYRLRGPDRSRRSEKGDTVECVVSPAIRPWPDRISRSPRVHSWSRWDNSGMPAGGMARSPVDRSGRARAPAGPRVSVAPSAPHRATRAHVIRATTPSTSFASTSKLAKYACGSALIRTSRSRSTGSSRTRASSRSRRRSLFRSTISRPYLGTITPTRAHDDGEAATRTSNNPVFTRFPVRLTSSISEARVNRCARENFRCDVIDAVVYGADSATPGFARRARTRTRLRALTRQRTSTAAAPSDAYAPSCGDAPALPVPTAWTSARGTHAS